MSSLSQDELELRAPGHLCVRDDTKESVQVLSFGVVILLSPTSDIDLDALQWGQCQGSHQSRGAEHQTKT